MTSVSVEIYFPAALVDAAEKAGAQEGRTGREQLEHWVRVGKSISEHSPIANHRVRQALRGELASEDLSEFEAMIFDAAERSYPTK
ncbi:TA system antitoxin ParD family protein [Dietzia timorensis]|uniref:TA system antitoxin ParD family protein n=1 Tax=Dietzia timorensis TaxID=499555 RepID=UPI0009EE7067|nr:hypothetical protein [Dietzia timorensis]